MKVILSRKGFDSGYGGCPSPILPDGTMISMPIPQEDGIPFENLIFNGKNYLSIWNDLNPKVDKTGLNAHLDPDIRKNVRTIDIPQWKPIFGQCSAAQTHLSNQGVGVGDLFLFFGMFKKVFDDDGVYKYDVAASTEHVIYGYLQIGEIISGNERHKYAWHPHAKDYSVNNNTMYIASDELVIDGKTIGVPGYGVLNYDKRRVLTKAGHSKSHWELPDFFKEISITYHTANSFKDNYFQSAKKGQEFVISEDDRVSDWVKNIILN